MDDPVTHCPESYQLSDAIWSLWFFFFIILFIFSFIGNLQSQGCFKKNTFIFGVKNK